MTISAYISKINKLYKTGNATEHCYPGDLQILLMAIFSKALVTNQTKNIGFNLHIKNLNLTYTSEKEPNGNVCFANNEEVRPDFKETFTTKDLLDYIYAILHSQAYREKYKTFLKIEFPKLANPKDTDTFWKLVEIGGALRQLHLLETDAFEKHVPQYPQNGNNLIIKIEYREGKVFINDIQYFSNVSEFAWNFNIGGHHPAQKWLKVRKGRKLLNEDIFYYQKMVVALFESERLIAEIDAIEI